MHHIKGGLMAHVTLDEEFNSLGSPWQTTYPWSPNGFAAGDMGSFLANPALLPPDGNPISVDNGVLTLSDFPKPADVASDAIGGLSRISGQLLTEHSFSQTYGYFEARMQMPAGDGALGAFWLLPESGSWPPELDVAEVIGAAPNTLVNTLHDSGAPDPHWTDVADMTQGFHTYAVDWEPDKITWYFDGQETFETPTTASMNQPMYVVLSTHSGLPGSWPGSPDPSLVSQMKVDYVHVYDANPYTSGGALTNSTDSTIGSPAVTDSGTTATGPSPAAANTLSNSPATVPPGGQTTTSNNTTVVNIGSDTLFATPSSDVFVFNGSDHATEIQNFAPDSDKLDFEMTGQDFSNVSITAASDGHAQIDFGGNQVSLPGVTPDQLGPNNFLFDTNNGSGAPTS
jgi:beta-glucanase (GH16 family)